MILAVLLVYQLDYQYLILTHCVVVNKCYVFYECQYKNKLNHLKFTSNIQKMNFLYIAHVCYIPVQP
jgi:hypothetical protein